MEYLLSSIISKLQTGVWLRFPLNSQIAALYSYNMSDNCFLATRNQIYQLIFKHTLMHTYWDAHSQNTAKKV